jgi:hypothetical protein
LASTLAYTFLASTFSFFYYFFASGFFGDNFTSYCLGFGSYFFCFGAYSFLITGVLAYFLGSIFGYCLINIGVEVVIFGLFSPLSF